MAANQTSPAPGRALHLALLLALVGPTFTMSVLPPALPMVAQFLGGGRQGEVLAQRAQSLPFLGLAIGGLLAGGLIDRWGLRRCLLGAALIYAAAGAAGGLASSKELLLVSCFVIGLAAAMLSCGLTTATGAAFSGRARARALGFQTAFSDAAAIGGGLTAALLAQVYGWRGPLAIYVGFGVLILALVAPSRLPRIAPDPNPGHGLSRVMRSAGSTYVATLLLFVVMGTQATLLPFHLAANGLTTPGARAIVLTSAPAMAILASIAYGLLSGRISDRGMALAATAVSVAGYAAMGLWRGGLVPVTLASMAVGCGMGLSFPMLIRAAFRRTPPPLHSYSIGLLNTAVFLGAFLSPLILGPLMRASGASALFLLCGGVWWFGGILAAWRLSGTVRIEHLATVSTDAG